MAQNEPARFLTAVFLPARCDAGGDPAGGAAVGAAMLLRLLEICVALSPDRAFARSIESFRLPLASAFCSDFESPPFCSLGCPFACFASITMLKSPQVTSDLPPPCCHPRATTTSAAIVFNGRPGTSIEPPLMPTQPPPGPWGLVRG